MRFRPLLLLLALASTIKAHAQIAIYGTFTGSHLGGIRAPYPYTGSSNFWAVGGGLGLYDDFLHLGPLRVGADLRGNILNSKGKKLSSGLAGLRVAFKPPILPIKPYLQGSVGVGSTNYGAGNATTNGLQYQIFGGVDVTFFPRLDWRVAEFGAGQLRLLGTTYPVQTVSTGLVFRIP